MKTNEMQDLLNKLRAINTQITDLTNQVGYPRALYADDNLSRTNAVPLPSHLADYIHGELMGYLQGRRKTILQQLGAEE